MKWIFAIAVVTVVVLMVRKARRQSKGSGEPAQGGYIASDSGSGSARSKEACSDQASSDCGGGDGGGGGD